MPARILFGSMNWREEHEADSIEPIDPPSLEDTADRLFDMTSKVVKIGVFVSLILAVVVLLPRWTRSPRVGEVAPADVLQEKYGLYAENRPTIHLNADRVPVQLRDLIPLAEKWGIGDDIIRADFEKKASEAEKRELVDALRDRYEQISRWLDTADPMHMSDEMAAFMYMMEAAEEVRSGP